MLQVSHLYIKEFGTSILEITEKNVVNVRENDIDEGPLEQIIAKSWLLNQSF